MLKFALFALSTVFVSGSHDQWDNRRVHKEEQPQRVMAAQALQLESFMGRWFQVMTNQITASRLGNLEKCTTFDFFSGPNGKVEAVETSNPLFDSQIRMQTFVELEIPNPGQPSKWKLSSSKSLFKNFWILKVGPKVQEKYEYSIISDPTGQTLYVLARNVQNFQSHYKQEVMQSLQRLGLNKMMTHGSIMTKPMEVIQTDCNYAPSPPQPVQQLETAEMTGRWYGLYENENIKMRLPPNAKCNYAEVERLSKNQMKCTLTTQTGRDRLHTRRMFYSIPDMKRPGELLISSRTREMFELPMESGLIIKVGPVVKGQYQYAIFSDALRQSVEVIVRDIPEFDRKYKDEVLQFLDNLHFMDSMFTQPVRVNHADCIYQEQSDRRIEL